MNGEPLTALRQRSLAESRSGVARSCALISAGFLWVAALFATGCSNKIGAGCAYSTECSAKGDRLCDPTLPGGYCTIFNCEPDTCPSGEAVCVSFGEQSCPGLPSSMLRFQRTFCMAVCEGDGDCRSGYVCRAPSELGATLVDTSPSKPKACLVPVPPTPPADGLAGVCTVLDASVARRRDGAGEVDVVSATEQIAPEGAGADAQGESDAAQGGEDGASDGSSE